MKQCYIFLFLFTTFGLGAQTYDKKVSTEALKKQLTAQQLQRVKDLERLEKLQLEKPIVANPQRGTSPIQDSLTDSTESYFKNFDINGVPQFYETHNYGAARATGVTMLRNNQLKTYRGKNMIIGEWDGARAYYLHPDLKDRIVTSDGVNAALHSTHVGGTLAGNGLISKDLNIESAEGMAPEAIIHSYDWENDELEMFNEAAKGLVISNHSYGYTVGVGNVGYKYPVFFGYDEDTYDYHYGYYSSVDSLRDAVAYNFPAYLPVFSAGNDGVKPGLDEGTTHYVIKNGQLITSTKRRDGSCYTGYNCIPHGNLGKNMLTVGAIHKTDYEASTYTLASFSSRGPSNDGRVKPDITAPGVSIISTRPQTARGAILPTDYYTSSSGTSMAAPVVTGGIALIQESAKEHFQKTLQASTIKALVTHTARDAGNIGPDYHFGWGVINIFESVRALETNGTHTLIEELALAQDEKKIITLQASGSGPLKVTIAWTDVPGIPNLSPSLGDFTISLVNDLDIRLYDVQNNVYLPWVLNRDQPSLPATKNDNIVDNIEQIIIDNPTLGATYRLEITHKDNLKFQNQAFSLIASGLKADKTSNLSIEKVEKREELKSYETPGVYVSLKGNTSFTDAKISYTLSQNHTVVFQGEQLASYDPNNEQAFFLALSSDSFFPETQLKYTLDVVVTHPDDVDVRDNKLEFPYYYYVEHLDTAKKIYLQAFNSFDTWVLERNIFPSSSISIGWQYQNPTGSVFSSNTLREDGISLRMPDNQGTLKTNPFYLKKDEIYNVSLWLNEAKNVSTSRLNIKVLSSFTNEVLTVLDIPKRTLTQKSLGSPNVVFTHYQNTFSIPVDGYTYLIIENVDNNEIVIDDFSMAMASGQAMMVDYTYNYPNATSEEFQTAYDLEILDTNATFSYAAWNEFQPKAYDINMLPINLSAGNYQYQWHFKGADYAFEDSTTASSEKPRLRFLEGNKVVSVQLTINEATANGSILTTDPIVSQDFFITQEHLEAFATASSTFSSEIDSKGIQAHSFVNAGAMPISPPQFFISNLLGFRANSVNQVFNLTYTIEGESDVAINPFPNPKPHAPSLRFVKAGDYYVKVHVTDILTDGGYFNKDIPIAHFIVHDPFTPIDQLDLETTTNDYILNWANPDFYLADAMSFEAPSKKDDRFPILGTYLKTAQFKGAEKLGWRAHNISPILAIHGSTSMVSESIDETTMEHQDIDNWFFTTQAYPSAVRYLSFYASQAANYNHERYQVYLLDASLVSDLTALSADDFISKGILVKTEQVEGLDEILPNEANPTVLKAIDLEPFGLMNKDVLIAFRHHTLAADKGSFLSIDVLKFHNKIREIGREKESGELISYGLTGESQIRPSINLFFETSGKSDIGWFSLNARTYPVKGYEIAEIDKKGNRTLITTVDKHIIDSFTLDKNLVSKEARKLSVTLLYDNRTQIDNFKKLDRFTKFPSNQSELDQYVPTELMVEINLAAPLAPNEDAAMLYRHTDDNTNIYLRLRSTYLGTVNYQIYDVAGHSLMVNTFEKDEPAYDQPIAIDGLHDGMYFIKIIAGSSVHYKKFTK